MADNDLERTYWGDLPATPTESGGTFGWALEVMRRGGRVRRKGWDGFHLEQLATGPVRAILFIEEGKPESVIVCNIGRDLLATDWEIAPTSEEGQ